MNCQHFPAPPSICSTAKYINILFSGICRAQAHAAADIVRHAGEKVDLLQSQQGPPASRHLSVLQQQELLRRLDSLSLHAQVRQAQESTGPAMPFGCQLLTWHGCRLGQGSPGTL